ncbi:hypothetical protein JEOAER750_00356 [Jeotgalicoccus aerolatus]|jgi:hypothetical protein|uniref:Glucan phosphoethanolaminetransferase (Alkaline phosphatase superfamily) n=1 Tax=Jeotgalicoccus aerolatus TaxID=709510 RepID=A0A1G8X7I7_9STAP|nr:hypothetical protein [Jeotgalicoccus aerolatus]MBP1952406.1 glucan phosphoethanolaminetransferase (alkaline phosphatase superfamily) [Jeotgalicoccus aerolatus]NMA81781.1 hypothetical protein [Jeotgalicoccus aerolatus]CAD2072647.1 hypothetical protein JEOAER750_00356 [Jeotgalicoccus aerolatus]SDJ85805.1 hypothetical protein SAMN05216187_10367 [Jeotgalicoccus aerolatus]GGE04003.1 hypothetical protein GCM10007273_15750 [Jeotgalicoccus aerolatus]
MKPFILIILAAINIYSLINISVTYQHEDLIALLSTRIIFMAVSIILSALFLIAGASRSLKIIAAATILTGLLHFISIILIYI